MWRARSATTIRRSESHLVVQQRDRADGLLRPPRHGQRVDVVVVLDADACIALVASALSRYSYRDQNALMRGAEMQMVTAVDTR